MAETYTLSGIGRSEVGQIDSIRTRDGEGDLLPEISMQMLTFNLKLQLNYNLLFSLLKPV